MAHSEPWTIENLAMKGYVQNGETWVKGKKKQGNGGVSNAGSAYSPRGTRRPEMTGGEAPPLFHFELHGQIPSGKNAVQITRTGRRYPKKRFKEWVIESLKSIGPVSDAFVKPVRMTVLYTPGNLIRRDAPGMLDALCHLIEQAGIVLDDCQVVGVVWEQEALDRKAPGVMVTLEEVES